MITLYTTPVCPACNIVKEYFKENNIEYITRDVSTNQEWAKEMFEHTKRMAVPVINIGDDWILGADINRIEDSINAI